MHAGLLTLAAAIMIAVLATVSGRIGGNHPRIPLTLGALGMASLGRQLGATLGVAVLGSVVTARIVGPTSTGFVSASHPGWLIMAGTGVALFVIGLVTTGRPRHRGAGQVRRRWAARSAIP